MQIKSFAVTAAASLAALSVCAVSFAQSPSPAPKMGKMAPKMAGGKMMSKGKMSGGKMMSKGKAKGKMAPKGKMMASPAPKMGKMAPK